MKKLILAIIIAFLGTTLCQGSECLYQIRTSLRDTFCIEQNEKWVIEVEKLLTLRFADVRITPKDSSFSLILYFKADTPDLAQFDTPEKNKKIYYQVFAEIFTLCSRKRDRIRKVRFQQFLWFCQHSHRQRIGKSEQTKKGEFVYLSRGMVRLSEDSVLGFSLMTNELNTKNYNELTDYILDFIKKKI